MQVPEWRGHDLDHKVELQLYFQLGTEYGTKVLWGLHATNIKYQSSVAAAYNGTTSAICVHKPHSGLVTVGLRSQSCCLD